MKPILTISYILLILTTTTSQNPVNVDGIKMFSKSNENITPGFKIFTLCQDQKLAKNCAEYYQKADGNYSKLPISKSQLVSSVKTKKLNSIKGIKKTLASGNPIYYFQNSTYNTYLAFDEASNLVIFPVNLSSDPIAIVRKAGTNPDEALEIKCHNACPFKLPPGCTSSTQECWIREFEKHARCFLKCKGKIRTTSSIAAFEGIVINTKSN